MIPRSLFGAVLIGGVCLAFSASAQLISLDAQPDQIVLQPTSPAAAPEERTDELAPSQVLLTEDKEQELQRAKLARDYETTLSMLEQQKREEMHKAEVEQQAAAFSREFFKLDMYSNDFAAKFEILEKKYPLAGENPLAARLIDKSRKQIARVARATEGGNAAL